MKVLWVLCCALTALCLSGMNESSVNQQAKVAYLTHGFAGKTCLQIDYGSVSPSKKPLDLGGFIHVSELKHVGHNCGAFHLSDIVEDVLIIIPDRMASKCFHFADCRGLIIIRNDNMVVGNSKCYDVLNGHYWHDQGGDSIDAFQIKNLNPRAAVCDYNALDKLIQQKALMASVSDIFSPVEDLIFGAIGNVEDFGNQFAAQINNTINTLQNQVTQQVNLISTQIQAESDAMTSGYNVVAAKLQIIDDFMKRDVSRAEKYFHIFIHIVELIGVCVIIKYVYSLYRRANGAYNFVRWIWSRIHPAQHHNANIQPAHQPNANGNP